jgi:GxxExxY protein
MVEVLYKEECFRIIGACMEVHSKLGFGFLEPVYQEALAIEFSKQGIPFKREKTLSINYKDTILNKKYIADFVCFQLIIVELKAITQLLSEHESQVLNYLKATGLRLGLLVNFGEKTLNPLRELLVPN